MLIKYKTIQVTAVLLVRVFMLMAVDANERGRGVCQANARVSQSLPSKLQAPLRGFLGVLTLSRDSGPVKVPVNGPSWRFLQ